MQHIKYNSETLKRQSENKKKIKLIFYSGGELNYQKLHLQNYIKLNKNKKKMGKEEGSLTCALEAIEGRFEKVLARFS